MDVDPDYPSPLVIDAMIGAAIDAVYQGARGAFSEEAAALLLRAVGTGAPQLLGVRSLDDLGAALQGGRVRYAIVPLHNSIAGDVPGAGAILRIPGAHIVAETTLPIVQCLVAPAGITRDAVRRVVSHPVALGQCRRFLDSHPHLRVESHDDTAGALKMLIDLSVSDAAAIAGARAARVWGGVVLQRGIQDSADNCTTFALLEQRGCRRSISQT